MRRGWTLALGVGALAVVGWQANNIIHVGDRIGDRIRVATGQDVPVDPSAIILKGRPLDFVLSPDLNTAYVKHTGGLAVVDLVQRKVLQNVEAKEGMSWLGIALSPDGKTLAVTDAHAQLWRYPVTAEGLGTPSSLRLPEPAVKGDPFPTGLTYLPDSSLVVCLNRANQIAVVKQDQVQTFAVDVAPYAVMHHEGRLYVSCWSAPAATQQTAESAGTKVDIDARGIGVGGTVVCLELTTGRRIWTAKVERQPTELAWTQKGVAVACSNGDRVTLLDPASGKESRSILVTAKPQGDAPQSLAVGPNQVLYIACGGSNRVLAETAGGRFEREVGWYPGTVRVGKGQLIVACMKGQGERAQGNPAGHSAYDFEGRLSILPLALDKPAPEPKAAKITLKLPIKHVVYIIKENRTYDQVFGDMKQGDGDPALAVFGRKVTPNHHRLAEQFVLIDNFYCNGVNSADGHAWATEANATILFERSHGGWTRSYPFGDDPLATSATGYIWDNVLAHGKTFRNYGEFNYSSISPKGSYEEVLTDFEKKTGKFTFPSNIGVKRVRDHSTSTPGWNMNIPDVLRADSFLRDIAKRGLADFTILYLPQDHTVGQKADAPTPSAHMADNDLALGRVIEALSRRKDWAETCVFVVEDDAQDGFDHVDGHRSVCLVLSPYTRGRGVWSQFCNQTAVIHTMETLLGLPPMTRFDAQSPVIAGIFGKPDLTPYRAVPNQIDLHERNPKGKAVMMQFDRPDSTNEEGLNRQIWASVFPERAYPARPSPRELEKRGLHVEMGGVRDDD